LADLAVRLINELTHTGDYSGQPFRLRRWQEAIVRRIFEVDRHGRMRHTRVFIALPRKQGKTELIAAILLVLLAALGRRGQEIYSASGDREQAGRLYKAASEMVRAHPTLSRVIDCYDGKNSQRLVCSALNSSYEALSSEGRLKHGKNPSVLLFDEVHVFPDRTLHDALTSGQGARRERLVIYITTAGYDQDSLCYELWQYARDVRDGVIDDPGFLPILYEPRPGDDWKDERVWRRVMPALGDFCETAFIRDECKIAQRLPSYQNTFCQFYLNMWTEQAVRWISLGAWDACRADLRIEDYAGRPCTAGLDLSSTSDLTAFVLAFENDLGGFDLVPHFWLPGENAAARQQADKVPYPAWIEAGLIAKTEGQRIDYDAVEETVRAAALVHRFDGIGYDPQFANQLAQHLHADGHGLPMIALPNTFHNLNPATREFERLVVDRKKKNPKKRIDGLVAALMAIAVRMGGKAQTQSVYATRGILSV